jgi:hypothetical protein
MTDTERITRLPAIDAPRTLNHLLAVDAVLVTTGAGTFAALTSTPAIRLLAAATVVWGVTELARVLLAPPL